MLFRGQLGWIHFFMQTLVAGFEALGYGTDMNDVEYGIGVSKYFFMLDSI